MASDNSAGEWSDCDESILLSLPLEDEVGGNTESEPMPSHAHANDNGLDSALRASARQFSLLWMALNIHNKRLDHLLEANGMSREQVPADDNCFFRAAALHVPGHDHQALRKALCDHLEMNLPHYEKFFLESAETTKDAICAMRAQGIWNNCINDAMPLVLANFTKRRVKIFNSKRGSSVHNVVPDLPGCDYIAFSPIYLAYLAITGGPEHYDGCLPLNRCLHTEFGTHIFQADVTVERPGVEHQTPPPQTSGDPKSPSRETLDVEVPEQQSPLSTTIPTDEVPEQQSPLSTTIPTDEARVQSPEPCTSTSNQLAVYNTPQKKRVRKRVANPPKWKKNCRKVARLSGEKYVSSRGKIVQAKAIQRVDCSTCKLKCNEKLSEQQQQGVFDMFYGLGNYERQKDFVCRHVEQKSTVTFLDEETMQPKPKKRQCARKYYLTVDDQCLQVCKKMFLGTLNVGQAYVDHALANSKGGTFCGQDGRGKHTPANKTSDEGRKRVRDHITSFPALESHYCRRNTQRKFLDSTLNVNRMYQMYETQMKEQNIDPVSSSMYREIFNADFNLGFHVPKKDQCLLCHRYHEEKRKHTLTERLEQEYFAHQERKQEARIEKAEDKKLAKQNDDLHVVTFDLQAVLNTPCSLVSQVHYKRKLAVYNLSIFSLEDRQASCFVWNETEGKKGACEIGTCLLLHLKVLPSTVKHVILYSDTCSGQNRNQYVAAGLHHAVQSLCPNIQIIDQKFLESGHTHMECDSMHAYIERAKKNVTTHIPDQWNTVFQMARPAAPYTVIPVQHSDIWDLKALGASIMRNTKTDIAGNRVNWLKMKWIRYRKGETDTIFFKYKMSDPFNLIKIRGTTGRRGRRARSPELSHCYTSRLPVSSSKKNDLLDLCRLGVIPAQHHNFYEQIPSDALARDCLPEPDVTEQTDSEYED